MSSLNLSNDAICRATLQVMGLGRPSGNMDAATEGDVRAVIRSGLRRFYFPITENGYAYQWRWLEKHHSVSVVDTYATGTIAASNGAITLSGGSFPADLTNYFIVVDGNILFITAQADPTHATTPHTQLSVTAGTSYTAYKFKYALPADFGEWVGGVVFSDGSGGGNSRVLSNATEAELRLRYAINQSAGDSTQNGDARTTHYAISATPGGTTFEISFWPVPAKGAFIQGVYQSVPDDNLPGDLNSPGTTVQVSPVYAEAVMESILTAAEEYNNDMNGVHSQRLQAAMIAAINHDKSVGGNLDFSRKPANYRGIGMVLPIDFSGAI